MTQRFLFVPNVAIPHEPPTSENAYQVWDYEWIKTLEAEHISIHIQEIKEEYVSEGEEINRQLRTNFQTQQELLLHRLKILAGELADINPDSQPLQRLYTILLNRGVTRFKWARHPAQDNSRFWASDTLSELLFANTPFTLTHKVGWCNQKLAFPICEIKLTTFLVAVQCTNCICTTILRKNSMRISNKQGQIAWYCDSCIRALWIKEAQQKKRQEEKELRWLKKSRQAIQALKAQLKQQQKRV